VDWGLWKWLVLEIVPRGVWCDRRPQVHELTLALRQECTHADVNWDWLCSEGETTGLVYVRGDIGPDAFPADERPVPPSKRSLFLEISAPFVYTGWAPRFRRLTRKFCGYGVDIKLKTNQPRRVIVDAAQYARVLLCHDVNQFYIYIPRDHPFDVAEDSMVVWSRKITLFLRCVVSQNDLWGTVCLRICTANDRIGPLRTALLACKFSADRTWPDVLRSGIVELV
jgi:hypothetical protein